MLSEIFGCKIIQEMVLFPVEAQKAVGGLAL
jgi:hypothetical protein